VKTDSIGIVDSCPGCGRPHTSHSVAKISKATDLLQILLVSVYCL